MGSVPAPPPIRGPMKGAALEYQVRKEFELDVDDFTIPAIACMHFHDLRRYAPGEWEWGEVEIEVLHAKTEELLATNERGHNRYRPDWIEQAETQCLDELADQAIKEIVRHDHD